QRPGGPGHSSTCAASTSATTPPLCAAPPSGWLHARCTPGRRRVSTQVRDVDNQRIVEGSRSESCLGPAARQAGAPALRRGGGVCTVLGALRCPAPPSVLPPRRSHLCRRG